MNKNTGKPVIFLALLFLISLVYFAGFGNGVFFYQENHSLFIFSGAYLREFLRVPGGLSEYMGNFISQGYYSSLYGSIVLSLFLVLFATGLFKLYKALSAAEPTWLILIIGPSCLLLFMQLRTDHFFHHSLGYLFLVLFTGLSIHLSRKGLSLLVPLLFPAFVHLTGSFAIVFPAIYTVYCLLHEKGRSRFTLPGILIIVAVVSFTAFEGNLLRHPPEQYLGHPLPFIYPKNLHPGDIILCTYLALFPLIVRAAQAIKLKAKFSRLATDGILYIVLLITVIMLGVLHDPEFAKRSRIEKLFLRQEWDKVIAQHEKDPSKQIIGPYFYKLALSEKGQLCDRMFQGSQDFGEESLLIHSSRDYIDRSMYYYYTVGFINEAHHRAYESMVINGYRPENLKMLIKTDLINEKYRSAERHIGILSKSPHYRKWAEKYESMLHKPALVLADPELGGKAKLAPRKDFFFSQNEILNIDLMLMSNPDNKVAFEYKLASLLLEKNFKSAVHQVKKMRNMNYSRLPRHVEEAILLFINQDHELPYLGGFEPCPELKNSFDQYSAAKEENPKTTKIENTWGTTFWYYYDFN